MRWFKRTLPLLLSLLAARGAAQRTYAVGAAGQQKKVGPAEIAKQYQLEPGVQGQLTLTPASQATTTNTTVTVTANCGSGFSCAKFPFVWGDGIEEDSTTASASHAYSEGHSYTVYATAQAVPNHSIMMASPKPTPPFKSNYVTVAVTAPQVPAVTLEATPSRVRLGNPVTLTATLIPADPDARFMFDYGDGQLSPQGSNSINHVYQSARDYQVTVIAYNSDDNALASSSAVPVSVVAIPPPALIVRAESGQNIIVGKPIRFRALANRAPPDIQYQFHWNDGTPDEIADADGRATHFFSSPGKKQVTVTGLTTEAFAEPIRGQTQLMVERPTPQLWLLLLSVAALAISGTGLGWWIKARGVHTKTARLTCTYRCV